MIMIYGGTPFERPPLLNGHFAGAKVLSSQEGFHCTVLSGIDHLGHVDLDYITYLADNIISYRLFKITHSIPNFKT